ncbi:MAG: MFS transporter [Alphaproteobacteria bacterium RIFCSPHIGHO2_12_FULL_63_12]|nr:MAG: MFS transporter [Alphaproteobacteria bacterium RIFCSPHIGHO2_12_FULL_63_12]
MRDAGRVAAAIAILEDFERRRVPLKTAIADWARNARFAGAKDRAWISGLCLDVLRRRRSLCAAMNDETPRAATLAALRLLWGLSPGDIASLADEAPHGPGALTPAETEALRQQSPLTPAVGCSLSTRADFPDFLEPSVTRAFGDSAVAEMAAFAARADVDLRLNTLQAASEKALDALSTVGAAAHPFIKTAARIAAPDATDRAPAVTILPAFNKGWVEVQDVGSQIAALAAGDVKGAQVLDLCAGGGGKTLALAALMANKGQHYAYDNDARRLQPLYERARRAGIRNLQILNPATDKAALDALAGKIDVVFIDAPCTGSGTWRRHPDTKWRLTPDQLARRMAEQDEVLNNGARFVKPGGRLVYVTCSFLLEENEDRLAGFLAADPDFAFIPALGEIEKTGLLTPQGRAALAKCETPDGALRLTPARTGTDGFFVAALKRKR